MAYTTAAIKDRLSVFTLVDTGPADPPTVGPAQVILETSDAVASNHHGGGLAFGPDGKLYWGKGDNGVGANAQDLTNIYLLVADVGNSAFDELNRVTAGGNYGWPGSEGICTSNCMGLINPIYTYAHGNGSAISSVLAYDGALFPRYHNKLFIADEVQGWIKVLTCSPTFTSCSDPQDFDPAAGTTVQLAQGLGIDGGIYQLTYDPGTLVRISPVGSAPLSAV